MATKDLLEIIFFILSIAGAVGAGAFSFATLQYLNEIKDFKREIRDNAYDVNEKALNTIENCTTEIRKLQQNHDNLLTEHGIVKCDIRDIKGVLMRDGILHSRAGFPEENIPRRTNWGVIEDA